MDRSMPRHRALVPSGVSWFAAGAAPTGPDGLVELIAEQRRQPGRISGGEVVVVAVGEQVPDLHGAGEAGAEPGVTSRQLPSGRSTAWRSRRTPWASTATRREVVQATAL